MNIVLTSTNVLKFNTLQSIIMTIFDKDNCDIMSIECVDEETQNQPINNTLECAKHRVDILLKKNIDLSNRSCIVTLENGLELENSLWYDVCYLYVVYLSNGSPVKEVFYKSFGVMLHDNLIKEYMNNKQENDEKIYRWATYGHFLDEHFGVDPKNWMSDVRFGNINRYEQLENVVTQWILDHLTNSYDNYPKQGIIFKDLCSLLENPLLLQMIMKQCSKHVDVTHDIDNIDYIVGLQSRGYLIGTVLANHFGKGFIAMRKLDKMPISQNINIISNLDNHIAFESYETEYSIDSFGLFKKPEYKGKNCLLIDDLCATGGSFVAASDVAGKAGLNVIGYLSIYDVESLREISTQKLKHFSSNIRSVIVRTNDHKIPYSFKPATELSLVKKPTNFICNWGDINLDDRCLLIGCSGSMDLTEKISKHTGIKICASQLGLFNNGETRVEINENIRKKHVIIVCCTRTGHINDDLMEVMFVHDACNRAGVDKVSVVLPYFPYTRGDKKDKPRVPISAAVVANMLNRMGVDNVISIDLHASQEQGFIDRGFHNLYVVNYMSQFIHDNYLLADKSKYVLVAPDVGSAKRIEQYAKLLKMNFIILHKQRDYSQPGIVLSSVIIGDRSSYEDKNKIGIIIDDIGDTFGTMISAINELTSSKNGIKEVIVAVTHGVLSPGALSRIKKCDKIKAVIVTNSLPQTDNIKHCNKIMVLDISQLIARTIDGIVSGKSVSTLFS